MHATDGSAFKPVGPELDPVSAMMAALKGATGTDAVRHFFRALDARVIPADEVVQFFTERDEADFVPALISGLANHHCPHCRGGFDNCSACHGSGHGEERAHACAGCGGVGILNCDFCGGSGLITYDIIPEELRPAVAKVRSDAATERVAESLRQPLPTSVAREQLTGVRQSLVKRVMELRRDLAILVNAAQLARNLHKTSPNMRSMTAQLFARSSKSAKGAKLLLGKITGMLGRISRACAASATHAESTHFELERANTFEVQSQEFARSARRRAALFPGH